MEIKLRFDVQIDWESLDISQEPQIIKGLLALASDAVDVGIARKREALSVSATEAKGASLSLAAPPQNQLPEPDDTETEGFVKLADLLPPAAPIEDSPRSREAEEARIVSGLVNDLADGNSPDEADGPLFDIEEIPGAQWPASQATPVVDPAIALPERYRDLALKNAGAAAAIPAGDPDPDPQSGEPGLPSQSGRLRPVAQKVCAKHNIPKVPRGKKGLLGCVECDREKVQAMAAARKVKAGPAADAPMSGPGSICKKHGVVREIKEGGKCAVCPECRKEMVASAAANRAKKVPRQAAPADMPQPIADSKAQQETSVATSLNSERPADWLEKIGERIRGIYIHKFLPLGGANWLIPEAHALCTGRQIEALRLVLDDGLNLAQAGEKLGVKSGSVIEILEHGLANLAAYGAPNEAAIRAKREREAFLAKKRASEKTDPPASPRPKSENEPCVSVSPLPQTGEGPGVRASAGLRPAVVVENYAGDLSKLIAQGKESHRCKNAGGFVIVEINGHPYLRPFPAWDTDTLLNAYAYKDGAWKQGIDAAIESTIEEPAKRPSLLRPSDVVLLDSKRASALAAAGGGST